jgi:hypothetical protein
MLTATNNPNLVLEPGVVQSNWRYLTLRKHRLVCSLTAMKTGKRSVNAMPTHRISSTYRCYPSFRSATLYSQTLRGIARTYTLILMSQNENCWDSYALSAQLRRAQIIRRLWALPGMELVVHAAWTAPSCGMNSSRRAGDHSPTNSKRLSTLTSSIRSRSAR